jgi:hypothetical protein
MNQSVETLRISLSLPRLLASLPLVLGVIACASTDGREPGEDGKEQIIVAPEEQGIVRFETLEPKRVAGAFEYHGVTLRFDSETTDAGHFITLELRGMTLTATIDKAGVFDLDGYQSETAEDTQMTEVDKTVIRTFEIALTEIYQERASELPALDMLNRAVTLWGDYSLTVPLQRVFYGRNALITGIDHCAKVNKPGQGVGSKKWQFGTHDCTHIESVWGTCAAITGGCMHLEDPSTTDFVFMSMHPGGSCDDGTFFGTSTSSFRCYEPDHDRNIEISYGLCFGRCGGSCGGGTVFSQACLDHDQCVRAGHMLLSPDCDDDFLDAGVDYIALPNCAGVNLPSWQYNWAGTQYEGNCVAGWKDTNDGCDVACQWIDGDCFR